MSTPPQEPPVYPRPGVTANQPTEPITPVVERGPYRDPYVADPRPAAAAFWSLESLRTALTIVGLIALIAVGLAVWALLRSDHNRQVVTRAPTTNAAVAALSTRVSHLQSLVRTLSSTGGTSTATTRSLAARFAALQQSEKQLATRVSHVASTAQVSQLAGKEAALSAKVSQLTGKEAALSGQVSQLQGRVSQLAGQVSQLKAQSGSQTSTTGTSTVP